MSQFVTRMTASIAGVHTRSMREFRWATQMLGLLVALGSGVTVFVRQRRA